LEYLSIKEENIMKKQLVVIGILIVLFGTSGVTAMIYHNTITNRPDDVRISKFDPVILYPTDDAHVRQNYPDNNEGNTPDMNIRNDGGINYAWQAVIRFDLSSVQIHENTTIKATLNCYYRAFADNDPVGRLFYLCRIIDDWNEETVTWNTRPLCTPKISALTLVPDMPGNWMKWDVTDDVIAFVDGSEQNYGWRISDDTYWGDYDIPITRFSTKEGISPPYLEIRPIVFNKAFLIGRITNIDTFSDTRISFQAQFLRCIQLSPFEFHRYTLGEDIMITKPYLGLLTPRFAFGIFNVGI